jgi:DNA-binding transcriptional MerR regulator
MPDNSTAVTARILDTSIVARRFKVTPRMVRYLVQRGLLPAHKEGPRLLRYEEADVVHVGLVLGYPRGKA